jgi:integrase
MVKITKRTLDGLGRTDRDVLLWDDELPGFGVRCRPSGTKFYFLKYRVSGGRRGRQRWITIGQHGAPWTPDTARREALRLKAAVSCGSDPSADRERRRAENTIGELADRYLAEHVAVHNKPTTASEMRRLVERDIKPALGRVKITDLTRADIKAWQARMRESPYQANRSLACLRKILNLAVYDWELRETNPCTRIRQFPERARDRFYSEGEMRRIGQVLAAMEEEKKEAHGFVLLIRLLATTGMRLSEVLSLRWSDIDLTNRTIRLRDAKAGPRTVHLGIETIGILGAIAQKSGWVIGGREPGRPLTTYAAESGWKRLRARAGLENARLHDLRHTVGTYAAVTGANAFAIRDLLGHKTLAMTGRYVERAADIVRGTADAVSIRVTAALAGDTGQEPTVVPLQRTGW